MHAKDGLALAGTACTIGAAVAGYVILPHTIPIHFNFHGQVDHYGSSAWLLALAAVAVLVHVLLRVSRGHPGWFNLPAGPLDPDRPRQEEVAQQMLATLNVVTSYLFAAAVFLTIAAALQRWTGLALALLWASLLAVLLTVVVFPARLFRRPS